MELLEEANDAADAQDSPARVRLLAGLARARAHQGDQPAAVAARISAVDMARRLGDERGLAYALGQAIWARGHDSLDTVLAMLGESHDLPSGSGNRSCAASRCRGGFRCCVSSAGSRRRGTTWKPCR